jgi:heme exporter protein CcmD
MIEWLSMGGYAYYVWMSYGALAIAIVAELLVLASRRRRALEQLAQHAQDEAFEEQAA